MGKSETFQDLSLMPPGEGQELGRWLYSELRAAILDGRLKPDPACRRPEGCRNSTLSHAERLRRHSRISRAKAISRREWAQAPSSYADSRPIDGGTGGLRSDRRRAVESGPCAARPERSQGVRLLPASHSVGKAFRSYEPAIDLFPVNLWSRVAGRVLRHAPRSLYGQGDARGYLPLRKAIAEYAGAARGVRCDAGQIIITSGTQQALDHIARMLLDPGDAVWMEDPGYPGAWVPCVRRMPRSCPSRWIGTD